MHQPHCRWVDTAFGGAAHRNRVMEFGQVNRSLPEDKVDIYATWHRFPDSYHDHWRATSSTKGYRGPSYAHFLPFDFDGENLEEVLDQVRGFLQVLEVTYEVDDLQGIRCFFSGKKGFHVCLSSALFGGWVPSPDLHRHLRDLAHTMGQDHDIDTAIYDQNRLFRVPNTRHSSGLWKIPLAIVDVVGGTLDMILEMATEPRHLDLPDWDDVNVAPPCAALFTELKQGKPQKTERSPNSAGPLFPVGLAEGDGRDEAAFRIARTLRDAGVPWKLALDVLVLWDSAQRIPLAETDGAEVLEKKIENAYGELTDEAIQEIGPDDVQTPEELALTYTAYIDKLKQAKIFLGWMDVDMRLRGVAPGEVLTVIARSGVGKSAFLQNALLHIAQQDVVSLFCSLEQPLPQCFERYAQMVMDQAGQDIEDAWESEVSRESITEALQEKLGQYALTCGLPGLSLTQLDRILEVAGQKAGRKVNLLAIDYLGLLDTADLDRNLYGQVSRAAREIKNLAKRHDVAILLLCQVSRAAGEEGDKPLTIHAARESGAIEESADFLLGLYRPDLHGQDEKIQIQILKNRKGQTGEFGYHFDKRSLRIGQTPLDITSPPPPVTEDDELPLSWNNR